VGLAAIKTVGEGAVRPLVVERKENGPYKSIDDFCRRAGSQGLNRRTMEALARAGSFDSLAPRGAVVEAIDQIVATSQLEARRRNSGQTSFFDGSQSQEGAEALPGISLSGEDADDSAKAAWEKELLGVSLSYNPLLQLAGLEAGDAINTVDQLDDEMEGETRTLLGQVSNVSERYTREQKRFLIVTLDLLGGPIEVVVWPNVLEDTDGLWTDGAVLRVTGKLRSRGDQMSLACDMAQEYSSAPVGVTNGGKPQNRNGKSSYKNGQANGATNGTPNGSGVNVSGSNGSYGPQSASRYSGNGGGPPNGNGSHRDGAVSNGGYHRTLSLGVVESTDAVDDAHRLREVIGILLEYPGQDRVNLEIHTNGSRVLLELPVVNTGYCDELGERLTAMLGEGSVRYQDGNGAVSPGAAV
jgi:DNA polymerase-3 subunit alpha